MNAKQLTPSDMWDDVHWIAVDAFIPSSIPWRNERFFFLLFYLSLSPSGNHNEQREWKTHTHTLTNFNVVKLISFELLFIFNWWQWQMKWLMWQIALTILISVILAWRIAPIEQMIALNIYFFKGNARTKRFVAFWILFNNKIGIFKHTYRIEMKFLFNMIARMQLRVLSFGNSFVNVKQISVRRLESWKLFCWPRFEIIDIFKTYLICSYLVFKDAL